MRISTNVILVLTAVKIINMARPALKWRSRREEMERRKGNLRVEDLEVQAIMYKICYKDVIYNTGNIANIL